LHDFLRQPDLTAKQIRKQLQTQIQSARSEETLLDIRNILVEKEFNHLFLDADARVPQATVNEILEQIEAKESKLEFEQETSVIQDIIAGSDASSGASTTPTGGGTSDDSLDTDVGDGMSVGTVVVFDAAAAAAAQKEEKTELGEHRVRNPHRRHLGGLPLLEELVPQQVPDGLESLLAQHRAAADADSTVIVAAILGELCTCDTLGKWSRLIGFCYEQALLGEESNFFDDVIKEQLEEYIRRIAFGLLNKLINQDGIATDLFNKHKRREGGLQHSNACYLVEQVCAATPAVQQLLRTELEKQEFDSMLRPRLITITRYVLRLLGMSARSRTPTPRVSDEDGGNPDESLDSVTDNIQTATTLSAILANKRLPRLKQWYDSVEEASPLVITTDLSTLVAEVTQGLAQASEEHHRRDQIGRVSQQILPLLRLEISNCQTLGELQTIEQTMKEQLFAGALAPHIRSNKAALRHLIKATSVAIVIATHKNIEDEHDASVALHKISELWQAAKDTHKMIDAHRGFRFGKTASRVCIDEEIKDQVKRLIDENHDGATLLAAMEGIKGNPKFALMVMNQLRAHKASNREFRAGIADQWGEFNVLARNARKELTAPCLRWLVC
jgi:hypothetical protein